MDNCIIFNGKGVAAVPSFGGVSHELNGKEHFGKEIEYRTAVRVPKNDLWKELEL